MRTHGHRHHRGNDGGQGVSLLGEGGVFTLTAQWLKVFTQLFFASLKIFAGGFFQAFPHLLILSLVSCITLFSLNKIGFDNAQTFFIAAMAKLFHQNPQIVSQFPAITHQIGQISSPVTISWTRFWFDVLHPTTQIDYLWVSKLASFSLSLLGVWLSYALVWVLFENRKAAFWSACCIIASAGFFEAANSLANTTTFWVTSMGFFWCLALLLKQGDFPNPALDVSLRQLRMQTQHHEPLGMILLQSIGVGVFAGLCVLTQGIWGLLWLSTITAVYLFFRGQNTLQRLLSQKRVLCALFVPLILLLLPSVIGLILYSTAPKLFEEGLPVVGFLRPLLTSLHQPFQSNLFSLSSTSSWSYDAFQVFFHWVMALLPWMIFLIPIGADLLDSQGRRGNPIGSSIVGKDITEEQTAGIYLLVGYGISSLVFMFFQGMLGGGWVILPGWASLLMIVGVYLTRRLDESPYGSDTHSRRSIPWFRYSTDGLVLALLLTGVTLTFSLFLDLPHSLPGQATLFNGNSSIQTLSLEKESNTNIPGEEEHLAEIADAQGEEFEAESFIPTWKFCLLPVPALFILGSFLILALNLLHRPGWILYALFGGSLIWHLYAVNILAPLVHPHMETLLAAIPPSYSSHRPVNTVIYSPSGQLLPLSFYLTPQPTDYQNRVFWLHTPQALEHQLTQIQTKQNMPLIAGFVEESDYFRLPNTLKKRLRVRETKTLYQWPWPWQALPGQNGITGQRNRPIPSRFSKEYQILVFDVPGIN